MITMSEVPLVSFVPLESVVIQRTYFTMVTICVSCELGQKTMFNLMLKHVLTP